MAAIRELYERETPSYLRLSAASALSPSWIRECAQREGWRRQPTGRPRKAAPEAAPAASVTAEDYAAADAGAEPEERLRRVMDMMLREVEAIGIAAQRQGLMPDKARMDATWSMIRMLEKAEEFARERAGGIQARRDEEVGDVLARIDRRIEELARAYAQELVRGELERSGGQADRGRMAAEGAA